MIKRCISGSVMIALVVGCFFLRLLDVDYFSLFVLIVAIIGTVEMIRACDKLSLAQTIITVLVPIIVIESYLFFTWKVTIYLLLAFVMLNLALLVLDNKHSKVEGLGYSFLCAIYPTALLIPIVLVNDMGSLSLLGLLLIFLITPCADTMAYVVGITFKGPKLCPKISPKKTISGGIGGLLGGIIGAIVLYFIMRDRFVYTLAMPQWLFFGLVGLGGAILTAFGDLVESVIKRQFGIKDMSNLIPGHGGVMDRIDGLMFNAPFIYLIFTLL